MDRLIPDICTGFHYLFIHSEQNVKKCLGFFSCQSVVLWFSNWFGALFAVWTTPFGFLAFFESMPSEQSSQMFPNFPNYIENNHCARATRNLSYHTWFFFSDYSLAERQCLGKHSSLCSLGWAVSLWGFQQSCLFTCAFGRVATQQAHFAFVQCWTIRK